MKWGVAWRNIKRYVKHDLKEIAFPSSLPDPPHLKAKPKTRKLTIKDYVYIVRTAASLHAKSFTREGLTKEDWKKAGLDEQEDPEVAERKEPAEPSSVEELALAARAGVEHIKPALQRIYMTRASAYRDALKSFVEGYQEGVAEVVAKNSQEESGGGGRRSNEEDIGQSTRPSFVEDPKKEKSPF
ncbi:uncharacterized protein [Physcomitrium patens]|uniref:Uncharacterized protein n=1 Tax=Physcomitrium patens TaxID=3218 RepID=A0A2K1KTT1_PHYPA|nr:uncharacterized protein LOC112280099 [Physcomitrium patens]PNR57195.1 hypothetical protein PHYPA_004188 [Physcomitrium patens]|eukprot:XP_024370923.1 uncharacterized protein LOC112280099 [Physcomitrella patens]